jgi:hypothetical protein
MTQSTESPESLFAGVLKLFRQHRSIATGRGKLQVQPCPQCPVSDGRPEKRHSDNPIPIPSLLADQPYNTKATDKKSAGSDFFHRYGESGCNGPN